MGRKGLNRSFFEYVTTNYLLVAIWAGAILIGTVSFLEGSLFMFWFMFFVFLFATIGSIIDWKRNG